MGVISILIGIINQRSHHWGGTTLYSTWFWQNVLVLSQFAPFICNTDLWFLGAVTLGVDNASATPLAIGFATFEVDGNGWSHWGLLQNPLVIMLGWDPGPQNGLWESPIDSKDWLLTTYKDDKRLFNHHLSTISPHVFYIYICVYISPHVLYLKLSAWLLPS